MNDLDLSAWSVRSSSIKVPSKLNANPATQDQGSLITACPIRVSEVNAKLAEMGRYRRNVLSIILRSSTAHTSNSATGNI